MRPEKPASWWLAVDSAGPVTRTAMGGGDECGIHCCRGWARGTGSPESFEADCTCNYWPRVACRSCSAWEQDQRCRRSSRGMEKADRVVAEANQGGASGRRACSRERSRQIHVLPLAACPCQSRQEIARAEPVAAL